MRLGGKKGMNPLGAKHGSRKKTPRSPPRELQNLYSKRKEKDYYKIKGVPMLRETSRESGVGVARRGGCPASLTADAKKLSKILSILQKKGFPQSLGGEISSSKGGGSRRPRGRPLDLLGNISKHSLSRLGGGERASTHVCRGKKKESGLLLRAREQNT